MADISDFVKQANAGRSMGGGDWVDPRDEMLQRELQAAAPEEPAPNSGVLGFLQNAGKSIGSDFMRVGQGTANLVHELTGGAQQERDQQQQSQEGDINFIKSIGEKMKNAKTDEERQRLRASLTNVSSAGDERDKQFMGRQSEIAEQNDPLKGGAAVASIGLDVLGGGTGAAIKGGLRNMIAQGAKQGALYGGLQGALEPVKEKGGDVTAEDIGGNAATGAGFGALTGGVLGAGARVAGKLAGGKAAETVSTTTLDGKPSSLQRFGKRLTESGSGLKADTTVGGVGKLDQQADFMSKYTGTPRQQRVAMEKDMGNLSNQVDDILSKTKVDIDGGSVGSRVRSAGMDLADERFSDLDINPNVQKIIDRYAGKFDSTTDAKGVNDIVKTVNKLANKANVKMSNPNAAPLTAQETAALIVKRAGDDALSVIPEIRPLKQNMAQIFEVTPQVARAGDKSMGVTMISGLNSRAAAQGAKGVQSKLGALLQGKGKKVDQEALSTAFTPSPEVAAGPVSTGQGLMQEASTLKNPMAAFGALVNPTVARGSAAAQPEAPAERPPDESSFITPDTGEQASGGGDQADEVQGRLQQAALQALAAGDKVTLDNIIKVSGLFASSQKSNAKKPMSSQASKTIAGATSGLSSLAQLRSIYDKSGVPGGTVVGGRDVFGGLGANLLGTAKFDAAADNVADNMVRARTGAAATKEELALYRSMLPQAFDSSEVAKQKMQAVQDYFTSIANQTGSPGGDLQEVLGL